MPLPLVAGFLGTFFAAAIGGMVARVLAALGLGVISYVGVTFVINQAVSLLHSQVGGMPSDIVNVLGMAGIDVFLSLVISARFGWITFLLAHKGVKRIGFMQEA